MNKKRLARRSRRLRRARLLKQNPRNHGFVANRGITFLAPRGTTQTWKAYWMLLQLILA